LITRRAVALLVLVACSGPSLAQNELLKRMTGTWDVQQRMWPGPKAEPVVLPAAIAERRLIRDLYLEEVMHPLDVGPEGPEQTASFMRHAFLNYNAVTSRYEYGSLDTRASQLMVEQSAPIEPTADTPELKLQGSSFLAPAWGNAKNVRFNYRLTIGEIKQNQQVVRLFLLPRTVLPRIEFLAFEYVYTKRQ